MHASLARQPEHCIRKDAEIMRGAAIGEPTFALSSQCICDNPH
jgi:hypothetical protein